MSVGNCVGVCGRCGERYGGVVEGMGRCGGCEEVRVEVWESVWGECEECRKLCRGGERRGMGARGER